MTTPTALSGVDAAWLHMERPSNRMVIAGFFQLAGNVSRDTIASTVATRLLRFERFKDRIVEHDTASARPGWERDPEFDLDRHVIAAKLPAPGDESAMRTAMAALASEPLDHRHPLWQLHVFENHRGGTVVFSRIHHCIADGFALINVLLSLCDAGDGASVFPPSTPHPRIRDDLRDALHTPTHAPRLARAAASYAHSAARLLLLPNDPHTPLRGPLVTEKHLAWTKPFSLAEVKSIARATGTSINDVLVATVTGALRTHLRRNGCTAMHDVHAMLPVNLRRPDESATLGNRFGLVVPALPISFERPLERLAETHRRMDRLKMSREAQVGMAIVHGMGLLPSALEMPGVLFFAAKTSLVLTNVPGPRQKLQLAGTTIERMMFWVPQSGTLGLGVSILSYAGEVLVGVMADAARMPDPERLVEEIETEFFALGRAAHAPVAHAV